MSHKLIQLIKNRVVDHEMTVRDLVHDRGHQAWSFVIKVMTIVHQARNWWTKFMTQVFVVTPVMNKKRLNRLTAHAETRTAEWE